MTAAGHDFDRLDPVDGDVVALVCACGWRSLADSRAAVVGADWDRHLAEVEPRP